MAEIDLLESKFSIISRLSLLLAFQGASANQEMKTLKLEIPFEVKEPLLGALKQAQAMQMYP